ncbi:hypothetical protein CAPN001_05790 [Capnocytophaga stomatis]|uniref:DNA mimic protein DMP19 C-terminal domain-containing protein n=1 Tax=Capnocytophaga stomatis TaxID=1848904 RepID=A0A250FXK1_9FLAO|nr:DUF4375 domain-containing protein [Capnocytophaga stomatis]ATA89899.1 hypothetical protein CGC58_09280 [Capnocytophaga stomatis]GIJ93751.1 hypothetical protein CAPN002_09690 [Capnocytophaga stomatis]GIJ96010.1 hypothetical protein CAPN001_05790 [Capnocytophaga stomatis]
MEDLFLLEDNDDFTIALYEILAEKCNHNPNLLNSVQKKIFLCILLENFGQADGILGFLQEEYSEYNDEVIEALREIGALKSAEIVTKAVKLLPADGSWFFETSDEYSEKLMAELDSEFSYYPDGFMGDLYRKYAEKHREELCCMEK